jgi:hypothetical protein
MRVSVLLHSSPIPSCFRFRSLLIRRKSQAKDAKAKSTEPTAREIRLQKVREHLEKEALEKEQKRALSINASAPSPADPIKQPRNEALADDSTENTPGNSDQEDVTVNDDEPASAEEAPETSPLPSSPISILSANTNPVLIHPPLSLIKQPVEDGDEEPHQSSTSTKAPNCGLLCGCI